MATGNINDGIVEVEGMKFNISDIQKLSKDKQDEEKIKSELDGILDNIFKFINQKLIQ